MDVCIIAVSYTHLIIDRLDASEYFTVTRRFHSPREMEAALLKNKIDTVSYTHLSCFFRLVGFRDMGSPPWTIATG